MGGQIITRNEIEGRVTQIFRTVFQDDDLCLRDEMKAIDIPSWDSLNNVRLVISIEQDFGLQFSLREIHTLQSVGELFDLIEKKLH